MRKFWDRFYVGSYNVGEIGYGNELRCSGRCGKEGKNKGKLVWLSYWVDKGVRWSVGE